MQSQFITTQVTDFQLDFAEVVEIEVVVVETAVVVVGIVDAVVGSVGGVVEKTAVVVAVGSNFCDCPGIVSYCLEESPDHSHAIS